jgi:hypothetical protein
MKVFSHDVKESASVMTAMEYLFITMYRQESESRTSGVVEVKTVDAMMDDDGQQRHGRWRHVMPHVTPQRPQRLILFVPHSRTLLRAECRLFIVCTNTLPLRLCSY